MAIVLTVFLAGCSSLETAMDALEKYSFHVVGDSAGLSAFNTHYIAIEGTVNVTIEFRKRGETDALWRRTFNADGGQVAYRWDYVEGAGFVIIEVPWNDARQSMPTLPQLRSI